MHLNGTEDADGWVPGMLGESLVVGPFPRISG